MQNIQEFWQEFLQATKRDQRTRYVESFYFGSTERSANQLLHAVLTGQKGATCSSKALFHSLNEPIPQKGALSIVTDWAGNPYCVIETLQTTELKFRDMTFEICRREGEDDDLASWRKNHIEFFQWEGQKLGYQFSEDMAIVFEDFQVVYRKDND